MKINLLPQGEQALVHKEYKLRRIAVYLTLFLCCVGLAIILLFPSFALTLYRDTQSLHISQQSSVNTQEIQNRDDLVKKFKEYTDVMDVVKPLPPVSTPDHMIAVILNDKTSDNIIRTISYAADSSGVFKMTIVGVSSTRESLVSFVDRLRKESEIASVDFPVSNLAKESSIDFSLNIVGKKK